MAMMLNLTSEKVDEIRQAFNDMMEGIPKKRRGEHLFAINEISLILDALDRQAKAK